VAGGSPMGGMGGGMARMGDMSAPMGLPIWVA
jgi:hypothetical protein